MTEDAAGLEPRVSRVRVSILVIIIIVILVLVGWNTQAFFRLNHVDYLLNQQEFEQGLALLDKLNSKDADNVRASLLRAKALTLTGKYEEVISVVDDLSLSEGGMPAEVLYWKTLAQFQAGHTTASRHSSARFLKSGTELPNGAIAIARALAGESVLNEIPAPDSMPFRIMFGVEQATYLALVAMEQTRLGHFDLAARVYERAFLLGNRNAKSLQNAALVSALIGDVNNARMYLDYAGENSVEKLRAELERRHGQAGQVKLTLQGDDLAPGRRRVDIARALAWVLSGFKTSNSRDHEPPSAAFFQLLETYAKDPVIQLCLADSLLAAGDTSAALKIYRNVQQSDPTLATQLRIARTTGSGAPGDILASVQPILEKLDSTSIIDPGKADPLLLDHKSSGVAQITAETPVSVPVSTHLRGTYLFSIIARSQPRASQSSLLYVKCDGQPVGVCYIPSNYWGLYSVKLALEPGQHNVKLSFQKDEKRANDFGTATDSVDCVLILITGSGLSD